MSETYFVSPQGSDRNSGDKASPFATLQKAHDLVQPGDTIYLRGGRYTLPKDRATVLSKSGTANNPIQLFAYPNETPIFDASRWTRAQEPYDSATKNIIIQDGDAWHVKGLELTGGPRSAYLARSVSNSRWEQLNIHHNDNTGFNLAGKNSNNNIILNSDFHHNFDPINQGQDADGVGIKFGSGTGNIIRNSRFFNNSDDGIDLWMYESPVTIENSWAFGNGVDRWDFGPTFEGNGNGYKLGGGRPTVPAVDHKIVNSLAWKNTTRGFDFNSNAGAIQALNNTSFENGRVGFRFTQGQHQLTNNISVGNETIEVSGQTDETNNSWTLDVSADRQDFLSTNAAITEGKRGRNGQLPKSDFLRLAPNSDLIDAGTDVGLGFEGIAPDLGAIESLNNTFKTASPIAQFRFEEADGNIAQDSSANGLENQGGLLSETQRSDGVLGQGIEITQPGQGVAIANSTDINRAIQNQRTVSLWFNGKDLRSDRPQILYEEGGTSRGLNIYVENGSLIVGGWNRPESQWKGTWLTSDAVTDNQWHHVSLVLQGDAQTQSNALTAYLDGQAFGTGAGSQLWKHGDGIGVGTVVGRTRLRRGIVSSPKTHFSGKIDEVQIYNQSLSAQEIQTLAARPPETEPPETEPPGTEPPIPTGAQHSANPKTVFVDDFGTPDQGRLAIQRAVRDSDAERVVIPNLGQPWLVDDTIFLDNADSQNKEIIFEEGVVVQAKPGAFLENTQPMFRIRSIRNVSLIGQGTGDRRATIKMNKEEYTTSEFGHILDFNGVTDYTVRGLRLTGAGGDGIHISGASFVTPKPGKLNYSENGIIEDIISENNRRQGISIDSAKDLIVRNSIFRDTEGTAPNAGIDVEPTWDFERIENVTIQDVELTDNNGSGLMFALGNLTDASTPVTATVENVWIENNNRNGLAFNQFKLNDDPAQIPNGDIKVRNVQIIQSNGTWSNKTRTAGLSFRGMPGRDDDPENLKIHLDQVSISETGDGEFSEGPIYFEGFAGSPALSEVGNVSLNNVVVSDAFNRPVIKSTTAVNREALLSNINGNVVAYNSNGVRYELDTEVEASSFDLVLRDGDRLAAPDLVDNPGFEADTNRWSLWDETVSIVPRETLVGNGNWVKIKTGGLGQSVTDEIEAGQNYVLSALGQLSRQGEAGLVGVIFKDETGKILQTEAISFKNDTPKVLRLGLTTPETFAQAEVFAWKASGKSDFFVDDVSLVQQVGGEVAVN